MKTITYYEIAIHKYNGSIYGRLRFLNDTTIEESGLYPLPMISDIVMHWKNNDLLGTFAIGTVLADNAAFVLTGA